LLDKAGFIWKDEGAPTFKPDDKIWHQQHEKIVEFKQMNGHCLVPRCHEQDKFLLECWVSKHRTNHVNDKIRFERKTLLDKVGFAWKHEGVHNHAHGDNVCHQKHAQLETEPAAQGHRKQPLITSLAEGGQMGASANKRDKAADGSFSSVEEAIGGHEKDANPSAVTGSAALTGSINGELLQEEATHGETPSKAFFPFEVSLRQLLSNGDPCNEQV
jgi:hypothetical protein